MYNYLTDPYPRTNIFSLPEFSSVYNFKDEIVQNTIEDEDFKDRKDTLKDMLLSNRETTEKFETPIFKHINIYTNFRDEVKGEVINEEKNTNKRTIMKRNMSNSNEKFPIYLPSFSPMKEGNPKVKFPIYLSTVSPMYPTRNISSKISKREGKRISNNSDIIRKSAIEASSSNIEASNKIKWKKIFQNSRRNNLNVSRYIIDIDYIGTSHYISNCDIDF